MISPADLADSADLIFDYNNLLNFQNLREFKKSK